MTLILRLQSDTYGETVARLWEGYDLDTLQQQLDNAWNADTATTVVLHEGGEYTIVPKDWQRMSIRQEWLKSDGTRQ